MSQYMLSQKFIILFKFYLAFQSRHFFFFLLEFCCRFLCILSYYFLFVSASTDYMTSSLINQGTSGTFVYLFFLFLKKQNKICDLAIQKYIFLSSIDIGGTILSVSLSFKKKQAPIRILHKLFLNSDQRSEFEKILRYTQ